MVAEIVGYGNGDMAMDLYRHSTELAYHNEAIAGERCCCELVYGDLW